MSNWLREMQEAAATIAFTDLTIDNDTHIEVVMDNDDGYPTCPGEGFTITVHAVRLGVRRTRTYVMQNAVNFWEALMTYGDN